VEREFSESFEEARETEGQFVLSLRLCVLNSLTKKQMNMIAKRAPSKYNLILERKDHLTQYYSY
jgi:hypothetical protein